MKTAMAILILVCGISTGLCESVKLHRRVRALSVFLDAVSSIKQAAGYTLGDIASLITLCNENAFLMLVDAKLDLPMAWKLACERYFADSADKALALEFMRNFGKTDISGLVSYLVLFESKTERQLRKAEESMQQKSKLYIVLGFFSGTAAALLLI